MAESDDEPQEIADEPSFVAAWVEEIQTASDEEKDWRKEAEKASNAYRGAQDNPQHSFNIFHANIETIVPALYNSRPTPDVRRRFADPDVTGKTVADIIERSLSYATDAYDFDDVMHATVFDMCVAGRGVSRIKYEPLFAEDGSVAHEQALCEYVPWRSFRRGPGRTWPDVGWVAFEHFLSRQTIEAHVPEELIGEISFTYSASAKDDKSSSDAKLPRFSKRARVFEVWDKENRRVDFISPDYGRRRLWTVPDPLGLQEFFPVPRPMQAVSATDSLVPITPFSIYEDLLAELNEVSRRITRLVKQVRPRGGYAGLNSDIKAITEAGDGELVPLTGAEPFAMGGGGIDKAITWFPLEATVMALKQLVEQREVIKATIYEVTKIADVMRGASNPNETLGAQQLKAQWGSLAVQRQQAEVARYARDLFRLKTEIIATKFDMQAIQRMTGIKLPPLAEKQAAQQRIAIASQPPAQPMPGAPPPAPPAPPSPQDKALADGPSLEECEQLLRADAMRGYIIDIESDSTIKGDLAKNQQQIGAFLTGAAQFMTAIGPMVQDGAMDKSVAVELFSAFSRQFKLGKSAEDALSKWGDEAKKPRPQQPDPRVAAEQAKLQAEQQRHQDKMQFEGQKHQDHIALETDKTQKLLAFEQQKHTNEMQFKEKQANDSVDLELSKVGLPPRDPMLASSRLETIIAGLAESTRQTNAGLTQALHLLAAPSEVVRDPRTGRAVGARKVLAGPVGKPDGIH